MALNIRNSEAEEPAAKRGLHGASCKASDVLAGMRPREIAGRLGPGCYVSGTQMSVRSSVGGTSRGVFTYSSKGGVLPTWRPDCRSQVPYSH